VSADGIDIEAPSARGAFYGTRTLRQMLPAELLRSAPARPIDRVDLIGAEIEDGPRFAWRGMGLDVSRHFMPKDFILKLVDLASLHKLNVLHLHLTDDQGWRVQIDRYPCLTEVGAWRRESPLGHYREGRKDGVPHGGFYTKADLAEIVAYAARRFVTVVPEIDMPGHMQAAIASYPELGNTGRQLEVYTTWGVSDHVLNLEASTVRFCADVLEEVMDIFPGPYVHIGGDECPITEWEASPETHRLSQAYGLDGPQKFQGWFTARMSEVVAARGRALMGWDEILDAGAPPGALIAVWREDHATRAATEAARTGHDVVMSPEHWAYFDWAYSDSPNEPLAIRPAISVEHAYSFEPVPSGLPDEFAPHILGAQCQLWTEYVPTPSHAEYMYFPRACAWAEVTWSAGERTWEGFKPRLEEHMARLDALGVNYRPLNGPTPGQVRTWATTGPN
jgi:hexosaminidase